MKQLQISEMKRPEVSTVYLSLSKYESQTDYWLRQFDVVTDEQLEGWRPLGTLERAAYLFSYSTPRMIQIASDFGGWLQVLRNHVNQGDAIQGKAFLDGLLQGLKEEDNRHCNHPIGEAGIQFVKRLKNLVAPQWKSYFMQKLESYFNGLLQSRDTGTEKTWDNMGVQYNLSSDVTLFFDIIEPSIGMNLSDNDRAHPKHRQLLQNLSTCFFYAQVIFESKMDNKEKMTALMNEKQLDERSALTFCIEQYNKNFESSKEIESTFENTIRTQRFFQCAFYLLEAELDWREDVLKNYNERKQMRIQKETAEKREAVN